MSAVDALLDNTHLPDEQGYGGGEELIRLMLRIYTDPVADDALRARAMTMFDRLMEEFSGNALAAVAEWDRT